MLLLPMLEKLIGIFGVLQLAVSTFSVSFSCLFTVSKLLCCSCAVASFTVFLNFRYKFLWC